MAEPQSFPNLITVNADPKSQAPVQFHLHNGRISVVLGVLEGKLVNLYTGAPVPAAGDFGYLVDDRFRVQSSTVEEGASRYAEHERFAYPEFGRGDYRHPAIEVGQPNGSHVTDLRYVGHTITGGKPALPGMPSTHAADDEAATLSIELRDELIGLTVTLQYTIFRDEPVIARSAVIRNDGDQQLTLERAASLSLDLPDSDYTMTEFTGAWAREREPHTQPLHPGIQQIESLRGASGPYFSPNAIFARPATTEDAGEAFGLAFVYSGNFDLHAEVDTYGATRLQLGINPLGFQWALGPGDEFATPEALLGYTGNGLNALSQSFHRIVLDHLQRPQWARRERPVLINNWEATYFDFTEDKLLELAGLAKKAGIELFVLDDGWFGARTSDRAGLGDWVANPDRLPEGIAGIARKINALGMDFGLWFEPEMTNKDSDLYRAHPDWIIATPGRGQSVYRNQYVLNFANPAVVDNIYGQMHAILSTANVAYIKWDMNRFISEAFDATRGAEHQGEIMHRYILGVYALYERLFAAFPDLIIEGCASGGSRFDYGILAYSPQAWTSDDTDAIERLSIQYGTSYFFPVATMGAHVSITPNHQTGRSESLATRANVAMFGTFGYEMDLTSVPESDLDEIAKQVAFFKEHASLLHNGDLYRLRAPYGHRQAAWMSVSADRAHAIVGDYVILGVPNRPKSRLLMRGLDETASYRVISSDGKFDATRTGGELMHIGIDDTDLGPDFASRVYLVDRV
ncbi:alpha-galactosidase [Bifidobacterium sp. 82T10]|uniref:Alpha-galactosidase n=1 Tax=Bifidobacterium miconis TaxID=2834435 RepID=A0ABS6WEH2_9BIFI|nr:alpha-galactosidase [Bifidobacterium miconis]MBW3092418.1 alpha-galactosidase [Bifidobacterium miconis]